MILAIVTGIGSGLLNYAILSLLLLRDSDGTATAAINEDLSVPKRTAKRGPKGSPQ